jgi:hypothetical protein
MLGGAAGADPGPGSDGGTGTVSAAAAPATTGGLVAVGPGLDAGGDARASSALASARELLDAAEAWRGRPVVPA